eukprot:scpid91179/ scgid0724/ 
MSAGGKAWSGSRHGSQKSESCITFCDYTGQSLQQELRMSLDKAKFFSIQTDGSTDAVNIEEELYLALFCDTGGLDRKIHVRSQLVGVHQPATVDADGLMTCFFF